MIVVLKAGSTPEEIEEVLAAMRRRRLEGRVLESGGRPVVHVTAGNSRRARKLLVLEQVEGIVPTSGPRLRRQGRRFYPYYFVNLSAACVVTIGLLVALAGHHPPGLGAPIDHEHAPEALGYPWYMRAPLGFVALFPPSAAWFGWLCAYALAGLVFLLPLVDRAPSGPLSKRWPWLAAGLVFAAGWVLLSLRGGWR